MLFLVTVVSVCCVDLKNVGTDDVTVPAADVSALKDVLVQFFNDNVAFVINKAVNQTVNDVEGLLKEMKTSIDTQLASITGMLDGIKKDMEKTAVKQQSAASTSSVQGLAIGKISVGPFPGYLEDYFPLIPVAMGSMRCGQCCTCNERQACLFNMYTHLYCIVNSYPSWQPTMFAKSDSTSSSSKYGAVLELVLRNIDKSRCKNCVICEKISSDPKISFLFGTNAMNRLFGGIDDSQVRLITQLLGSDGSQGATGQPNVLPFLLSVLGKSAGTTGGAAAAKPARPVCPFTCPSGSTGPCPQGRSTCDQQPQTAAPAPSPAGAPTQACPGMSLPPAGQAYGVSPGGAQPAGQPQPAYGIPFPAHGVPGPANQAPPAGTKPVYGLSYGSYN